MRKLYLCILLALPLLSISQTDEINVSAAMEPSSLGLTITRTGGVSWTFTTVSQYLDGYPPSQNRIDYEVSATTNFSIQVSVTQMTSATGETIDMGNLTLRPGIISTAYSERGFKWDWEDGQLSSSSTAGTYSWGDVFFGNYFLTPFTLITPGIDGNAGDAQSNQYSLRIGFGRANQTQHNNLPPLLDQNIIPGTYTGQLTLTAIAEF
ncbi:MAG: hypothetical protein AAF655_27265 [Bacteroidota bacterium]